MKTKLLKKVRKRFNILYNKEGHYFGRNLIKSSYYLMDKQESWNDECFKTLEEAKNKIMWILRKEYANLGKTKIKNQNKKDIKVWWKKN